MLNDIIKKNMYRLKSKEKKRENNTTPINSIICLGEH